MKIRTKLWRRSKQSFATTIPESVLMLREVDKEKKYFVNWEIDIKNGNFVVTFEEIKE